MGFHRAALVHKSAGGALHIWDPFLWYRTFAIILAASLFGSFAAIASFFLSQSISVENFSILNRTVAGGLAGTLIALMLVRRSKYGIERNLIKDHTRWLMTNETVLIIQAPAKTLRLCVASLRESSDIPPPVFVLYPKRENTIIDERNYATAPSVSQIQDIAKRLAGDQRADTKPQQNVELLRRLKSSHQFIHEICFDLSEAGRMEQGIPPTAEWLLDNEHSVEGNALDVQINLPHSYYKSLPTLIDGPHSGMPRVYGLAKTLVSSVEFRLDRENILAFIRSYQSVNTLTIRELWAIPQMMRIALIRSIHNFAEDAFSELRQREIAAFWANRLAMTNRQNPKHLFSILAELSKTQPDPSPYFASQLVERLHDEEAAVVLVRGWLDRTCKKPLSELNLGEQRRQARDQISIGNAFTSLRQLALLDWREIFEKSSFVEQLLRTDPSGIYPNMNFDTRDKYRKTVEYAARQSSRTEEQIAQYAVNLAAQAVKEGTKDKLQTHVGTYLIGEKRQKFARLVGYNEKLRFKVVDWIRRHHCAVYFTGLVFFSALFIFLIVPLGIKGQSLPVQIMLCAFVSVLIIRLAVITLNYLITRMLTPRILPKMDFEVSGIPDEFKTLAVVPVLLVDRKTIMAEVEKLEIRYLANKETNLLFGLFTDYTDHTSQHRDGDEKLLKMAIEGLQALNKRHGGEHFFLFHRERIWSESEQKFIGWERKRGKLEELNRMINATRPDSESRLVYVGDKDHLYNVRFIITLDSDTQLPLGSARRMVETIAHPMNQPRFDSNGRIKAGSYTIIQPRVSPSLPSASASLFSRLFADAVGIDPYTNAVSDVYQDLSGEGSYHGKGIYDVNAFGRILSGKFPEELVLSHDLIEGAHVRVGLASDIELYDDFPQDYISYADRNHRWIRGDWQIIDWIFPSVPQNGKQREKNPLSWFNRWKILDNLLRSLLPAASLGLLIVSWFISPKIGRLFTLVVFAQFILNPFLQFLTMITSRQGLKTFSFSKLTHDFLQTLVKVAMLVYETMLTLDAILRTWYRRLISHRKLLEWTSTQTAHRIASQRHPLFIASLGLSGIFSIAIGWVLYHRIPSNLMPASPLLILWLMSPLAGWLLTIRPRVRERQFPLPERDKWFLRKIARRTWRYFSDFVNEETSWLPPDNYQVSHKNQLAMRTSPTNIGLWMISALSAGDLGYITADRVIEKLTHTMDTLGKMQRHDGHLLNWYDVRTLVPLEPRYVSTVDSGNLLGALWSLEHGLNELFKKPVIDARTFEGLCDSAEILKESMKKQAVSGTALNYLEEFLHLCKTPPLLIIDSLALLRHSRDKMKILVDELRKSSKSKAEVIYWAEQLESQISDWSDIADRYLGWVEILGEKDKDEILQLGTDALSAIDNSLRRAPSLFDIVHGHIPSIAILRSIGGKSTNEENSISKWLNRIADGFAKSKWLAGEVLSMGERLIGNGRQLSDSIDFSFLYDSQRHLFSIGYNVSEGRMDNSYYDLLMSEARLGSFVAIARGDVPIEHWFSMSRPHGMIGRDRVLLSWTGTMFEYLMPLIFQRSYGNTILDEAAKKSVAIQINYGQKRSVPWGLSESAFGDLDLNKIYQYEAFGVPGLGLKRGLEEKVVVAPYACLLAVNIAPAETVNNLKKLDDLGLLRDYGYYEAIDFSRQPIRGGGRGVMVQTYMAHHEGMGFLSLVNFLNNNSIQRYFHSDARVRAVETLLHERIPVLPPTHHISTRTRAFSVEGIGEVSPSVSKFDTPHTATPKTQLLHNGRYGLMITNSGGGYSRWNNLDITRWRSDRTCDSWGTFCYIYEPHSNKLWSNTYHPVGGKPETYSAEFALDRAVFRRTDNGIHTETEVIVSPEDDVEIRKITLINRSDHTRSFNFTSYIELSMAPHNADIQHPTFSKLFIQTEAVPEHQTVLAYRRSRTEDEPSIYVAHRITYENAGGKFFSFETDRRKFVGRGRTLVNPMGAFREPGSNQGFVLDPILSLRHSINIGPGQRAHFFMVIAAGPTRRQVLDMMSKYGDCRAIDRTMDLVWASSQLQLRLLRIQPSEARRFQQLAGRLLFPTSVSRTSTGQIVENSKGQSGLWPYGISGDLPIVLITIGEARYINLVRQMLKAHKYWRMHGLMADLVILNEEAEGYDQKLNARLKSMVQAHMTFIGTDSPSGIFLRNADQIPIEDRLLIKASASVVITAARGTILQDLSMEIPEKRKLLIVKKPVYQEPSAALPFMELPYFNSLGGFTNDGREYVIYLGNDNHTPAPWVNVIANPSFGTLVSETGAGFTWYGNSQRNRLTQWSNDPVMDTPSEAIYIRDEETGAYWSPTPSPIRENTAYRAKHGAGYTIFEHNSNGIEHELTVFVPVNDGAGDPVKLQKLRLKNDSPIPRKLSITYYVEWTLGENRQTSQMHISTRWDDEIGAVLARNRYHPEYSDRVAFASIYPGAKSYSGDRTTFIGRNNSLTAPAAMKRAELSRRTGEGFDPCAGLQATVELAPGQTADIKCIMGQAESVKEVHRIISDYRESSAFDTALTQTKKWWDKRLNTIEVHTPELATDFMINRWLLYQNLSCRMWGRSAFYQSGGAFGFRDQLQDVMSLLYSSPELARNHILLAAGRQFREGDVQHWWHPPCGMGVRSRISDDLLWLPYVTARYVFVTGDKDILNEKIPFLEGPLLKKEQSEAIFTPDITRETATLFEHCRRAVAHSMVFGANGLPLMGTGDWNDGMNTVGSEGRGESVWLAWFMVDVLKNMSDLCEAIGNPYLSRSYERDRKKLIKNIEKTAWDGQWYIRATFDNGTNIGSSNNKEAKIDSLPQSWAWLTGAADPKRANSALESAWKHLVREDEKLVLLFTPPFDKSEPSPGYIQGYPPGVRENGGQYTHAAVWLAMAMARRGDGMRAAKILHMLNPVERARDPETVWRYEVEPYVISADVYRSPGRVGHGGWSWYTGSAGWMYKAWVEEILGLKVQGGSMQINPVIPQWWNGFQIKYRYGKAVYEINVENPEHCSRGVVRVEMDGKLISDGIIPLKREPVKHRIIIRMGKSDKTKPDKVTPDEVESDKVKPDKDELSKTKSGTSATGKRFKR